MLFVDGCWGFGVLGMLVYFFVRSSALQSQVLECKRSARSYHENAYFNGLSSPCVVARSLGTTSPVLSTGQIAGLRHGGGNCSCRDVTVAMTGGVNGFQVAFLMSDRRQCLQLGFVTWDSSIQSGARGSIPCHFFFNPHPTVFCCHVSGPRTDHYTEPPLRVMVILIR